MIYVILAVLMIFTGCSAGTETNVSVPAQTSLYSFSDIDFVKETNDYAENFTIETSKEGISLITINGDRQYLIVNEKLGVPEGLPDGITVIRENAGNIFNCSSSTMDFFVALDTLDSVTLTGTESKDWSIPEVVNAMRSGEIEYVGKYSAPDYEYIADSGCALAIENTMIFHSPEAMEMLESMGIPVLIEYSSYENHPFGRMEWIKVYGLITGKYDEACKIFEDEVEKSGVLNVKDTGKRVAFFYISSNGYAVVRKPGDYVTKMIEMAGGEYAFAGDLGEEDNMLSTMRMQMETFFSSGYDADILIYNSTIDGGVSDLNGLLDKSGLLRDFEAVKNGNVFCTDRNVFQSTMSLGRMIEDFSKVINEPDVSDEELTYLFRLE